MNQYERIVSYIHQYQEGTKGANVGYAKIEKRGDSCRIQVQMRSNYLSHNPRLYLYKQLDRTIRTALVGEMAVTSNEMYYKGSTEAGRLFGSGLSLDEIDGLLLYRNRNIYFATSWKNDSIDLGDWMSGGEEKPLPSDNLVDGGAAGGGEKIAAEEAQGDVHQKETEETSRKEIRGIQAAAPEQQHIADRIDAEQNKRAEAAGEILSDSDKTAAGQKAVQREGNAPIPEESTSPSGEVQAAETAQVQMQAICGVCPFKRQNMDYGKRILLSFPTMRPFPEEKTSECVRLELQDIGCLPMRYWSLSGNRFLLHGYYCYRHLIFCQREKGKYVLGVPGIYSEREQKNASRFGFPSFQSIGEFGKQRGAFGYWFMELM